MGQLPLNVAGALSVWMEVLLYGMYCSLFFESVWIIVKMQKKQTTPSKIFFGATVTMFIFATLHIALNLYRFLRGYVWLAADPGPVAYFNGLGRWDNIAHDAINAIVTWIGDSLVIYRCFVVWGQTFYVIIVPTLLLILSIIANSIALHLFTKVQLGAIFSPTLVHWMNTIYAVAFVQNTMTTGLIAFRIWRQDRETRRALGIQTWRSGHSLLPLVRIIIESAMVYVLEVLVLIILYALGHNGQYVVQEAIVPTVGIVFTLITVRVAIRNSRTMKSTTAASATRPLELRIRSTYTMPSSTEDIGAKDGCVPDYSCDGSHVSGVAPKRDSSTVHVLTSPTFSPGELDDREREGDASENV